MSTRKPLTILTKLLRATSFAVAVQGFVYAQGTEPHFNNFSLGFSAGHYKSDLGLMVSITIPSSAKLAARFSGGVRWSENYFVEKGEHAPYTSLQAGMVWPITIQERVRVYGETGLNILFPHRAFSTKKNVPGAYGAMGLDFSIFSGTRYGIIYFFESGITLNPARAERLEEQPKYSNGFTAATGFRFLM
jgi:hypothetical protein